MTGPAHTPETDQHLRTSVPPRLITIFIPSTCCTVRLARFGPIPCTCIPSLDPPLLATYPLVHDMMCRPEGKGDERMREDSQEEEGRRSLRDPQPSADFAEFSVNQQD